MLCYHGPRWLPFFRVWPPGSMIGRATGFFFPRPFFRRFVLTMPPFAALASTRPALGWRGAGVDVGDPPSVLARKAPEEDELEGSDREPDMKSSTTFFRRTNIALEAGACGSLSAVQSTCSRIPSILAAASNSLFARPGDAEVARLSASFSRRRRYRVSLASSRASLGPNLRISPSDDPRCGTRCDISLAIGRFFPRRWLMEFGLSVVVKHVHLEGVPVPGALLPPAPVTVGRLSHHLTPARSVMPRLQVFDCDGECRRL